MVLSISNRQRGAKVDLPLLQCLGECAVPLCLKCPGRDEPLLAHLGAVEISLVSDRAIAQVHRRFMNLAGATDVITFAHGEIVISAATAKRQAAEFGQEFHGELARYIVHGLLHLNGHEDATEQGAAAMWSAQETIMGLLWRPESAPITQKPVAGTN